MSQTDFPISSCALGAGVMPGSQLGSHVAVLTGVHDLGADWGGRGKPEQMSGSSPYSWPAEAKSMNHWLQCMCLWPRVGGIRPC